MAVSHQQTEAILRGARMLRTALGPAIAGFLEGPSVVEVMLNPDGRLWIDRLSEGLSDTGARLSPADGERIVRLVAHHVGAEVHAGSPRVSAELPETGERFEGLLPPVVARSEEHTSELQSRRDLVCRLLLEKKNISTVWGRSAMASGGLFGWGGC